MSNMASGAIPDSWYSTTCTELLALQVMAHIAGDRGALPPWEQAGGRTLLLATLGPLRGPVLGLLCRDPAQRLAMATFVEQCEFALAER